MKETLNYKLKKPEYNDIVNVDDFNYNADVMEKELKRIDDKTSNITVGDIKFSDGKTVEEKFTEVDNNISAKETPQASQEKANKALDAAKSYIDEVANGLGDKISILNGSGDIQEKTNKTDFNSHLIKHATDTELGHVRGGKNITIESGIINAYDGAWEKIGEVSVSGTANEVVFSNIPSNYRFLKILIMGSTTSSDVLGDTLFMKINPSVSGTYKSVSMEIDDKDTLKQFNESSTAASFPRALGGQDGETLVEILINNYFSRHKRFIMRGVTSPTKGYFYMNSGVYKSNTNSKINGIRFNGGSSLYSPSSFILLGVR